jgi:hypothetical protein
MSIRKRVSALAAMAAALAVAGPVAAAGAQSPVTLPNLPGVTGSGANLCLTGVVDPGPFGPMGPYGPGGPYGANGPLHSQPNPIGNAATCGGLLTYVLRGGDLTSFVNASIGHP